MADSDRSSRSDPYDPEREDEFLVGVCVAPLFRLQVV
jgi:hypothetical protein